LGKKDGIYEEVSCNRRALIISERVESNEEKSLPTTGGKDLHISQKKGLQKETEPLRSNF